MKGGGRDRDGGYESVYLLKGAGEGKCEGSLRSTNRTNPRDHGELSRAATHDHPNLDMQQNTSRERLLDDRSELRGGPRLAHRVEWRAQDAACARGAEVVLEEGVTEKAEQRFWRLVNRNPVLEAGADKHVKRVYATGVRTEGHWRGSVHPARERIRKRQEHLMGCGPRDVGRNFGERVRRIPSPPVLRDPLNVRSERGAVLSRQI